MQAQTFAGMDRWQKGAVVSLLLGCFAYPFSVAALNIFFGVMVILSCIRFEILKKGLLICWTEYRLISVGVLLWIFFTMIGSLWSEDMNVVAHKIVKQVNWLLLPIVVGLVSLMPKLRFYILSTLSIALFLHLIVCTSQYFGLITIVGVGGSSQTDPSGFISHLAFGFVYSIWVGFLLITANNMSTTWRLVCYTMAAYAIVSIFLTGGRSGYLITFAILILLWWKAIPQQYIMIKIFSFVSVVVVISSVLFFSTQFQHKLETTVRATTAFTEENWVETAPRIKLWLTALEVWKSSPYFGVGTGDYTVVAHNLLQNPELSYLKIDEENFPHPHNEFLFSLTRWGPLGLLVFVYLCWAWLRTGWKKDWQHDTMNAYLCTASALAIIINGMTDLSLNSVHTSIYAILMLAFSMTRALPEERAMAKGKAQ